jgi:hypothetical protein
MQPIIASLLWWAQVDRVQSKGLDYGLLKRIGLKAIDQPIRGKDEMLQALKQAGITGRDAEWMLAGHKRVQGWFDAHMGKDLPNERKIKDAHESRAMASTDEYTVSLRDYVRGD